MQGLREFGVKIKETALLLHRRGVMSGYRRLVTAHRLVVKSYRAKMIALVLLSVLVPSGVIWVSTVMDTERFQTRQTREKFDTVLNNASRDVNYWYRDRRADLEKLLDSNGFQTPYIDYVAISGGEVRTQHRREVASYFSIIREKFPLYETFVLFDRDEQLVMATSDVTPDREEWLAELCARATGRMFMADAEVTEDRANVIQWVAVPVDLRDGTRTTVCVRMNLEQLGTLLSPKAFPAVSDLYLLNNNMVLITQPRIRDFDVTGAAKNMIGERPADGPSRRSSERRIVVENYKKLVPNADGTGQRTKYLGGMVRLSAQQWWLVCEAEQSRFIAPVISRKNWVLIANLLICFLFVFTAWKVSSFLLDPLAQLSEGAKRINAGMVGVEIRMRGDDEIGQMITAFNDMAKRISVTEAELNAKAKQLQNKNEELLEVNEQLETLSVTDGLTGLYNHRHFWALLGNHLERRQEHAGRLALILLDIDNFKDVNDHYGHSTGDLLIQRIAKILRDTIRDTDLIARYGGEEYAVLLPKTNQAGVMRVSEKVREAIEHMVFRVPETSIEVQVTVSIGVSIFKGSEQEFFNAADRALYQSKSQGKNRVSFEMAMK